MVYISDGGHVWPDGRMNLDRVSTLPTRLHVSVGGHPMIDHTKGRLSICWGSPLSCCGTCLGLQTKFQMAFGPNGDRRLVSLIYATVLLTGQCRSR